MFRFNEFCSSMFLAIVSIFFTSPNAIYGLYSFFSFFFILCIHFLRLFHFSDIVQFLLLLLLLLFCSVWIFFVFFIFFSRLCLSSVVILLYSLDERIVCCSSLLSVFLSLLLQDNIRCLLSRMQMHFERNAWKFENTQHIQTPKER